MKGLFSMKIKMGDVEIIDTKEQSENQFLDSLEQIKKKFKGER